MQTFFNKSNEMPSFSSPSLQCHLCLKLSLYAAQTAPYFETMSLEVTLSLTLILLRATKDLRSGASRSQIEGDDPRRGWKAVFTPCRCFYRRRQVTFIIDNVVEGSSANKPTESLSLSKRDKHFTVLKCWWSPPTFLVRFL